MVFMIKDHFMVVDILIVGHGFHDSGTFHFQIFPAVEKQVVTSAPRLQWLPLSSVRTFMEIDERVFTSKLSSSSPCTLSKKDILFIFTTMGSKIYLTYLIWIPPTNLCPLPPRQRRQYVSKQRHIENH